MVNYYKCQRTKRERLICMPADSKNFYERFVEPSGIVWFKPLRSGAQLAASVTALNPVIVPAPTPAPAPTQPVVIVSRKPVAAPRPTAPPVPMRLVAAAAAPKLPKYSKDLNPIEKQKLLVITNRMFGRNDVIRADQLPEGSGLIEAGLSRAALYKFLDERVVGGFVTTSGSGMQRVWRLVW